MSDAEIFNVITFGSGTMPAYAAQMAREDRWKAILHLRTLQNARHPRTASTSPLPGTPNETRASDSGRARRQHTHGLDGARRDRRHSPPPPARSCRRPGCGPAGCWSRSSRSGSDWRASASSPFTTPPGSTWSVAFRRVPEALAGTLPFSIGMMAILFFVHPQLYGWTTDESLAAGTGAGAGLQALLAVVAVFPGAGGDLLAASGSCSAR